MIYRLTYCNKEGVEARVDIQKGSLTPVIEVEGTERPFILSYNNDKGDKSGMFLSSSADIEIYETTDFNIDNLKTSNETELSVTHYINNVVSWQGFIIPDFFSIEVRSNPVITMTASDRLGTLKNVTLSDLPSIISLRELAILCLNKTGLELTLRTMADFNNGTGVNDFFNSKILTQRLSDTKGRSISCYDILSSILTASYSFLVQRSGGWHIINKIQHEAGSGKLYTGATSFINWADVVFNFSDISIGGRRTIIPVASTVGVFHEFGGGKLHPDNYDFAQGTTGWVASGGYSMNIEDREIKGYSKSGSNWVADFGQTTTKKRLKVQNFLNFPLTNLDSVPYAKATFPLITTNTSSVDISMDMSVMGMPWYRTGVVILAEKGETRLAFSQSSGKFEPYDPRLATNPGYPDFMINLSLPVQGSAEDRSYYDASTKSMKFSGKLEDSDLTGWNITIRLYGYYSLQLGSRVDFPMFFSFANVSFSNTNEIPKGNIYKTEKDGDFTKAHDIDTSIFADYITYGLNGFFYEYPIDDTSSLYNSANELTTKWTAYNDTEQLPLLQHITRQRSRLFSVAHDLLSAEIEVNDFDPLAIFVACNKRHTIVSAQFDFFKSNLSVELEEIDFQSASARDFIYSYFGDGESGIKSIGGISGGSGGGGTGGGLTPEQLEILSWWKKDPDDPDTIFTEMNAYSTKELSAYGAGDGEGGDGSDYERLDTWASYDSSRADWVLSAFLGNDLNTRVTAIDGRVADLENSAGSGSVTSVGVSVPTGLSVSNSPITSSGVIAIGLQTGYSIPTTAKQGDWDTAYGWGNHSDQNYFKNTYLRALSTSSYDANNGDDPGGFVGSYSTPGWLTNGAFTGYGGLITWKGRPEVGLKLQMQYDVGHNNPTGGRLAFRTSNSNTDNDSYTTWKVLWHSGDFTSTDVTNWNTAFNNSHTHSNKTQLDLITQSNIDVLARLSIVNGNLQINGNAYATGELSAYGAGTGGGSGGDGIIETVYGYGNLGQTFNNANLTDTFNAYTINQLHTRLNAVEAGAALSIVQSGSGNAITSISKSGTVITASKDLTFSLSNHLHTGVYEPVFSKNTAFNKNFGTTAGTVAEGNHTHNYLPLDIGRPVVDLNTLYTSGITGGGLQATNRPIGSYQNSPYMVMQSSADRFVQLWFDSYGGNNIYYRNGSNSVWGDWVTLHHTGNLTSLSQLTDNIGVATHIANTSNPHSVTKAQVGLGNVDNTSDLLKPISTATQMALNLKLDKSVFEDLFEKVEVSTGVFAIKAKYNFYGVGEVSAYGIGSGGGSGGDGIIETVYGYGNLGQTFNNANLTDTFNAYTINQINTRLVAVESGSATSINTTGTGNAITSISKVGSVITANKDLAFLETSIFNTHNTDNVRHITGAERTKWDGVVTDFGNLEIGGRNLARGEHSVLRGNKGFLPTGWISTFNTAEIMQLDDSPFENDSELYFHIKATNARGNITLSAGVGAEVKYIKCKYSDIFTISAKGFGNTLEGWVDFVDSDYNLLGSSASFVMPYNTKTGRFEGVLEITIEGAAYFFFRRLGVGVATGVSSEVWFNNIKIEKGTIPTDWTPAPEDQVSDWNTTDINSFSFIKNKPTLLSQFTDNIGVATHIANTSNPHSVTKSQVGLGNVDNTSDLLKPISTATQTALNGKVSKSGDTMSGSLGVDSIAITSTVNKPHLEFSRVTYNYITSVGHLGFITNYTATGSANQQLWLHTNGNTKIGAGSSAIPTETLEVNGNAKATTFIGALSGNAATATALQTARTIWGQSFNGEANVSGAMTGVTSLAMTGALSGATTITASTSVTVPKVIFNAAGWSMEQVGSELQMKHNNVLKMRFTSTGSIVATEEITAFG